MNNANLPDWERTDEVNIIVGFFNTIKEVMVEPTLFFRKVKLGDGLFKPFLFAIIMSLIAQVFSFLWNILLVRNIFDMTYQMLSQFEINERIFFDEFFKQFSGAGSFIYMILTPILVPVFIVIFGSIAYLIMLIFAGFKEGHKLNYNKTLRAIAYSYAPSWISVIPFFGGFIGGIWVLVLMVIGIREVNETTTGVAFTGVFGIFILVICCCCLVWILLFSGIISGIPR